MTAEENILVGRQPRLKANYVDALFRTKPLLRGRGQTRARRRRCCSTSWA